MKNLISILILAAFSIASNGQSNGWSVQTSPTAQNLNGISYSDVNTWIAVGDGGTIIRSSNGGIDWVNITSPITDNLRAVCMHGSLGLAVGIAGRVARTTDGGLTWIQETRPTTRDLYSVSISNSMAVITGQEGFIFVSTDNGLTWVTHTAGTASSLFGVSVNGTFAVGVGGAGAVVMSVNGGAGWGLTVLGSQLTFFYGTSFVNGNTGWAVGSIPSGNLIIRSDDAGFVWTGGQTVPTNEQLFGVSFASMDTGTAVGGNGTIIHTVNGMNWVSQASGTTQILNGVSFANTSLGIAVGNSGTILRTSNGGLTGVNHETGSLPSKFSLSQNYPNPFNPSTMINYQVSKSTTVRIAIYDVLGTKVKELVNGRQNPGSYSLKFDASGLASGMYFYKLEADEFTDTKKMILVK